ncbi:MAG: PAS domain S-box protein, partial [Gallionella sp.]|nr:PAS domain S-box protein [Gallionella sp.]
MNPLQSCDGALPAGQNDGVLEARVCLALTGLLPILSVTESIEALLGFTADDYLSARVSLKQQIHPHDTDIADMLFSSGDPGTSANFNIRLRHANGRIRCISGQYSKAFGPEGLVLDLLLQDPKTLQRTLSDVSTMVNFRAMMENTDDYIYFKDRHHVFTGASQTLVSLCDPADHWTDLLGQTDYDVFPEEYADIYYRLEKQIFFGMPMVHEIQETLTKDGRKGWVDNRKYPIHDEHGKIIGLYGIARDITEHKQTEEALRHTQALLTSSEKIGRVGGWEIDVHTLQTIWTEGVYDIYELDGTDRLTVDEGINYYTPASRPIIEQAVQGAIEQGEPFDLELEIITAKGNRRSVHAVGKPDRARGKVTGFFQDITERVRAGEAFNKFFEQPMGLNLIAKLDGVIQRVNQSMADLLGYGSEHLVGVNFLDLVHPDDRAATIAEMDKIAHGANTFYFENRYRQKSGEFRLLAWSAGVSTADQLIFAVATDITERKRAALQLAESESRRRAELSAALEIQRQSSRAALSLMEDALAAQKRAEESEATLRKLSLAIAQSPESIVITKLDGEIEYVNDAFMQVTGYSHDEVIGKNPRVLHSGKTPPETYAAMWAALTQGQSWKGEFHNRKKDGTEYIEFAVITPLRQPDGSISHYVAVKDDITEKKRIGIELNQYRNHLEELVAERTAALNDTLFALESVGTSITRAEVSSGKLIYANRYASEFLGYSPEEMLELSIPDIDAHITVDTYPDVAANIRMNGFVRLETDQRHRDGHTIPVELTAYFHEGEGGAPDYFIGFGVDITQRRQFAESLQKAKDAAEAATLAKSAFLANMSHEIRTPMNAIIGLTHLMQRADATPEQVERLTKIDSASRHLLSIINDILDLSKLEASKLRLEDSDFNLSAVLDNVASIITPAAQEKGIAV